MKLDRNTMDKIHPLAWDVVNHLKWMGCVGNDELESTIDSIGNHGMEGGVAGFIYDDECRTFLRRDGVLGKCRQTVRDYADGIGEPLWRVASRTVSTERMSDAELDICQQVQIDGAMLLCGALETLHDESNAHIVTALVWFVVVRVAYAFEDCPVDWRAGDPGDPERAWDGRGDFEKVDSDE